MLNKKTWSWIGALALVVGGVAAAGMGWASYAGPINRLGVDISRPHAYVSTPALSRLPRDIVKAPVAREFLTEDFAFYYEEHEDRLGFKGALKRIAFEHETTLGDKLLELALDEPAEVALWTDEKGAPRHWLIAMTRGLLAKSLQGVATVAANDRQLSVIGEVRFNGSSETVYALRLSPRRTLGLVSQGNRVVVLSDPGLLFDDGRRADDSAREVIAKLLSGDEQEQGVYRQGLGLGAAGSGHTLVADAKMLSFGYQHFFPGVQALRVDIGANGASLRTQLRVNGAAALPAAPADRAIWQALPLNAAACTLLPADWTRVKTLLQRSAASKDQIASLADHVEGPAAICWYARSQLHTPVLVAQARAGAADPSQALDALSDWLLPASAEDVPAGPATRQGTQRWQKEVAAPWGPHTVGDAAVYRPTLARQGRYITFSPDDRLVDLALDAQARRYPAMADALPAQQATLMVLAPAQIADLARREAFAVIPEVHELFLDATRNHLVPRLDAFGKLPATRAVAKGAPDGQGWVTVEWQPVASPARQP